MKRNLYLTTIPVDEAKKIYLDALGDDISPRPEIIDVTDSLGRITAEAVYAKFSSPLYNSAAMDGIAVISSRTNWASESSPVLLRPGEDYVIVDTGDPIRKPYDAVIMAEDLQETPDGVLIRSSAPAVSRSFRSAAA